MHIQTNKKQNIRREIDIPGDKSISHRSIILSSLARGKARIKGFLESEDCLKTIQAFQNMGVEIERLNRGEYIVNGVGIRGLKAPHNVIDCGNSGTLMRLLTGLLATQKFYTVLNGDVSLRLRPMDRIIQPLSKMGAKIWARCNKYAPLSIKGSTLKGLEYKLPVASAQVKSAILLAGLQTDQQVKIIEPALSRDHTERLLAGLGVDIKKKGHVTYLPKVGKRDFDAQDIEVPRDISSAAFFIVAGLITQNSEIILKDIGINPTRSGFIEVVNKMGGDLEIKNRREISGEPIADLVVRSSELKGTEISGDIIPTLIDEIPAISIMASQAEGETIIKDARELRVKETDRIKAMVSQLSSLNVNIEALDDGMIIRGPNSIKGGIEVNSFGDHRVAMSLTILGFLADNEITIKNSQNIHTSFPEFEQILSVL